MHLSKLWLDHINHTVDSQWHEQMDALGRPCVFAMTTTSVGINIMVALILIVHWSSATHFPHSQQRHTASLRIFCHFCAENTHHVHLSSELQRYRSISRTFPVLEQTEFSVGRPWTWVALYCGIETCCRQHLLVYAGTVMTIAGPRDA